MCSMNSVRNLQATLHSMALAGQPDGCCLRPQYLDIFHTSLLRLHHPHTLRLILEKPLCELCPPRVKSQAKNVGPFTSIKPRWLINLHGT